MKKRLWIGAGGNQGDRMALLREAVELLNAVGVKVVRTSSFYETEPVGFVSDDLFLNAVFECETTLSPFEVLEQLLETENRLGRTRSKTERYTSRTLDLDLLFFEKEVINNHNLCIPHPLLHTRMFVLAPLNELIPDFIHPVLLQSVKELLEQSVDQNTPVIYQKPFSTY